MLSKKFTMNRNHATAWTLPERSYLVQ